MSAIIFAGAIVVSLLLFFLYKAIGILKKKPEHLDFIGKTAIATGEFNSNKEGFVRFHGEYWKAQSKTPISSGQKVSIIGRDGLLLFVEPLDDTT